MREKRGSNFKNCQVDQYIKTMKGVVWDCAMMIWYMTSGLNWKTDKSKYCWNWMKDFLDQSTKIDLSELLLPISVLFLCPTF